MELGYIHEFVVLARICSYSEAASQLYIAQSTLSKHIQFMEKELGHELFDRTTRRVTLSSFGRDFLTYATKIDDLHTAYTEDLLAMQDEKTRTISIGICSVVTFLDIPSFLPKFGEHFPDHQIRVIQRDPITLRSMLERGEVSMIITTKIIPNDEGYSDAYDVIPFSKERLVAVLPQNHPLARCATISVEQLFGNPYIALGLAAGHDDGLGNPAIQVDRASLVMELVKKHMGISVIPRRTALSSLTDGVVLVPLNPSPLVNIDLVLPHRRVYTQVMQSIITYLTEKQSEGVLS